MAQMRQVPISDIFNKEQAKELKKILEEAKRKNLDPLELTDVFKQTFAKWKGDYWKRKYFLIISLMLLPMFYHKLVMIER
jgi:hypothetical protein